MIDYCSDNENPISLDNLIKDQQDETPNQFNLYEILDYSSDIDSLKQVEQQVVEIIPTEWTVNYELQINSHFNLSAQLISTGGTPYTIEKVFDLCNQDTQILLYRTLTMYNLKLAPGVFYLEKQTGGIWFKLSYPLYQQDELSLQQFKQNSFELMRNSIKQNIEWLIYLSNLLLLTPHDVQQRCLKLSALIDNEYELKNKYPQHLPTQNKSNGPRQLNEINIKQFGQDKTSVTMYSIRKVNSNVLREDLIQQNLNAEETANLLQIGQKTVIFRDLLSSNVNDQESGYTPFLLVYFYSDLNTVYLSQRYICRPTLRMFLEDNLYKLSLTTKLKILLYVCYGVYFLHKRQITHTFINLDSIYIGPKNQATLGYLQYSYCEKRPSQHKIMNKPQYIPPEYGKGMKITDKIDIFQIGILMLQFLYNVTDEELEQKSLIDFEYRIYKSGLKEISICIAQILFKCITYPILGLNHDISKRPSIGDLIVIFKQIEDELSTFYST